MGKACPKKKEAASIKFLDETYRFLDYEHPEKTFFQKSRTFGQSFWTEIFEAFVQVISMYSV